MSNVDPIDRFRGRLPVLQKAAATLGPQILPQPPVDWREVTKGMTEDEIRQIFNPAADDE